MYWHAPKALLDLRWVPTRGEGRAAATWTFSPCLACLVTSYRSTVASRRQSPWRNSVFDISGSLFGLLERHHNQPRPVLCRSRVSTSAVELELLEMATARLQTSLLFNVTLLFTYILRSEFGKREKINNLHVIVIWLDILTQCLRKKVAWLWTTRHRCFRIMDSTDSKDSETEHTPFLVIYVSPAMAMSQGGLHILSELAPSPQSYFKSGGWWSWMLQMTAECTNL